MSETPPGWYPDTNDPSRNRWWNGHAWSDPPPPPAMDLPPPPAATSPQAATHARFLVLGGAGLLVAAAFLPWLSFSAPFVGTLTMVGIEGDGMITAGLGVIVAIFGWPLVTSRPLGRGRAVGATVAAALAVLVAIGTATNVSAGVADLDGAMIGQVGVGIWLTILAGAAGFIGGATAAKGA